MDNSQQALLELSKGERLTHKDDDVQELFFLKEGTIKAYSCYGVYTLQAGAVIGLIDCYQGICAYNYIAESDCSLLRFNFSGINDIAKMCQSLAQTCNVIVVSSSKFIMELIKTYITYSMKAKNTVPGFITNTRIHKWELDKFSGMASVPVNSSMDYYGKNNSLCSGTLIDIARFGSTINEACGELATALDINLDYVEPEPEAVDSFNEFNIDMLEPVQDIDYSISDDDIKGEVVGSLQKILTYSEVDKEIRNDFTNLIITYRKAKDKVSLSDEARKLRHDIAKLFYVIYEAAFKKSLDDVAIPQVIEMFLNFGYVDEELFGMDNTIDLYRLSTNIEEKCNMNHIYTCYNWLKAIYWGDKEPSKNNLDMDYGEYVKDMIVHNKIAKADEAEALSDNDAKLNFEIQNMFTTVHKITYGRISTFTPILIEGNVTKNISSMLNTADKVIQALTMIKEIDYSVFYREVMYANPEIGIDKELLMNEVLPDIILMPTTGIAGAMWQEIEGRKRNSPARFMFPILSATSLSEMMGTVVGRYRWELCKRVHGGYWNVVTEKSLTSEYYDYIQFYKKNHDISEAGKEKIKSALTNARNNYREVFVKDYLLWLTYESKGSSRLNKPARTVLAKYCPFSSAIRTQLAGNPMFADYMALSERHLAPAKKRFDLLLAQLESKGYEIPKELRAQKAYYSK